VTAIVRPARVADAPAICAIWNRVIRDSLVTFTTIEKDPDAVAAGIGAGAWPLLVAEGDGRVLGLATYGPFRSGPGYAFAVEHSVHLDPGARRQGVGRMLMAGVEKVAADAGKRVMVAAISGANPGAVAFHAAMGFAEVGRMPGVGFKGGQWLDLVLMQKDLAATQQRT
jgi:phosphinothricin acetyltransferase